MRFFFIPAAVLSLLFGFSLWNARAVEAAAEPWRAALEEAAGAASDGDWARAERLVDETRAGWAEKHAWFHIVTAHDELDEADALFAQAKSFAEARDAGEFRASVAQLRGQLLIVSERQMFSVKNIL